MQFAGVLPPDAPDPMDEIRARVRTMAFPVMGLTPQRTVEDHGSFGVSDGHDSDGLSNQSVSISYTLWRNPDDRDDPANLAELDERTRAALDEEPPWPRPGWLVQGVQRMRYPQLWEVVRTTWNRDRSEYTSLSRQLVDHANYILMNRFGEELRLPPGPLTDRAWEVTESAVDPTAELEIDGRSVSASEIDTDPLVYAIGAHLSPDVVVTVVVSREDLPYLRIALTTRARES
ncbi:hypothetical protein GCM10009749_05410 [Agromyces neolithicus]|uniref:DUF4255 domain-containing protein n=2 Tax=Agromyces neolithicus TaxID=269420 RepID=A0ABP4Y7B7_9MICO